MKANDPAYPSDGFVGPNGDVLYPEPGLTKRELAVLMAMQGLCANSMAEAGRWKNEDIATYAVSIADATLAAMEEE